MVKEYFLDFYALNNDITLDLASGTTTIHDGRAAATGRCTWSTPA